MNRKQRMKLKKICLYIFLLFILLINEPFAQKKFLFDATKAETAGNADWVICAVNGSIPRSPAPDQSTITQYTLETYWTGALSSWGIDLVKLGYKVESLPPNTQITYGDVSNPQDLSNYDVFIIDEPNSPFNDFEKTAILYFVKNGGGLFMISDHNQSDRNNDGWDSPKIWNDLMTNNSVKSNPFGISIDLISFNDASTNVLNGSSDPLLNGPTGNVTNIKISAGTTFTLFPSLNSSVKGVIWKSGVVQNTNSVLCGYASFGSGKVVFIGDSSPADDGTGQAGNSLYPGWLGVANGDHRRLHLNASIWLAKKNVTSVFDEIDHPDFALSQNYPNP
ncbi:MAG: hypothetical protein HYV28_20370, partial [Ignavibacteriales bacterium]|nr:hypothetical protein [Ignavibacteriales bacterium]